MKIELFNTWEEKWNRIPRIELKSVLRIGFSKDWIYYIWTEDMRAVSIIRVWREGEQC